MYIEKSIKWIDRNIEWIKALDPLSIYISPLTKKVEIHANGDKKATKEYFKEYVSLIKMERRRGTEFLCTIFSINIVVFAFFTEKQLEEMGIKRKELLQSNNSIHNPY